MTSELRDPRAFKVVSDDYGIAFPKDDDVLAAVLGGDRPGAGTFKIESYRTGQTIPPGRLPLSASAVLVGRGDVVPIERAAPSAGVTPVTPVKPAAQAMPAAPVKNGGRS